MSLRFFTNFFPVASRNAAAGIFIVGMLLIGFGFLIYILRDLFAILFAILFCAVGLGCIVTAVKIFWSLLKMGKRKSDASADYRENVTIHRMNKNDFDF